MDTFTLQRTIPADKEYDIIIAGGGPAGTAAAIAAGRLGETVLLVEQTGCLGGMGTSGLVNAFDPMADGERQLVGGIMSEIVEEMYERSFLAPQVRPDFWRKRYHCWTPFKSEGLKLVLDEKVIDAGVDVKFYTRLVEADVTGQKVNGVVIHNIEGLSYVPGRMFIDATGDAVLADLAGAECRTNPEFMPGTLASLYGGIEWDKVDRGVEWENLVKAIEDGYFTQRDRHLPGMSRVGDTIGYLNGGHLFNKDPLTCSGRTEGMMLGRRLAQEYQSFYRNYLKGYENAELVCTANLMGVRETRRILGEYELTIDDYRARAQFPDQIGVFNKFVDIHVRDCSDEEYERFLEEKDKSGRLGEGECFGLPYRILVPKGWENLWAAGRCNSSDIQVHGSIRVMPAAAMMGQAAGTAAVQSIDTGQAAFEIDTDKLRDTLAEADVILD